MAAAKGLTKPFDSITINGLREGKAADIKFALNGWILESYLNKSKTYKNDDYEPLMEIYCFEYYFVLEKTGELKVYEIHIDLGNLQSGNYGSNKAFYIKRHDLSYVGAASAGEMIKARSAMALDYQIQYQSNVQKDDEEIHQIYRYADDAYRISNVNKTGDGIIDKLNAFIKLNQFESEVEGDNNTKKMDVNEALKTLGLPSVPKTEPELRAAFSKLAHLYHEVYGTERDAEKYNAVKEAYDYLSVKLFNKFPG